MLEEIGFDYKVIKVDINNGEQFKDEFKKIFEECQEKLKNKPPQSALNATAKVSDNFFHKYLHVS